MKHLYCLLTALVAILLCACEPNARLTRLTTKEFNALAPYSVDGAFTFVSADGSDTVGYEVSRYDIDNNGCNPNIYDCPMEYNLDTGFNPVGFDTSDCRLFITLYAYSYE